MGLGPAYILGLEVSVPLAGRPHPWPVIAWHEQDPSTGSSLKLVHTVLVSPVPNTWVSLFHSDRDSWARVAFPPLADWHSSYSCVWTMLVSAVTVP